MRFTYESVLRKVGIAALTSVLLFYVFVYIKMGSVWLFNTEILIELTLTFCFLLSLFWVHGLISRLFAASPFNLLPTFIKILAEGALVVGASILLCFLLYFIPFKFIFTHFYGQSEQDLFSPARARLAYMVSSLASLFFYYFIERERSREQLQQEFLRVEQLQKENFKAQLESLKNQVNPHFLFNSLNVLNSLIYTDQEQAAKFLNQLAEVYRALLNSGDKQLVTLQKELELADAYIYLMKTRFGENINFLVNVPVEFLTLEVPPTSVQMLIENAIKHNGFTAQKPLEIRIFISENKLVVENNLQPRLEAVSSTKVGLQNICNRYKFLTDEPVDIKKTKQTFVVAIPLLQLA